MSFLDHLRAIFGRRKRTGSTGNMIPTQPAPPPPPKPMKPRIEMPDWMGIAMTDLQSGVREIPGQGTHPRIRAAHAVTTLKATSDEVAWCSSIMNLWMLEAHQKGTKSAAARSWWHWGQKLAKPVPGAVAVLWRGGSRDPEVQGPGHVALYVGPGQRPGYVTLLGGNQSNAVTLAQFPQRDVFGYRWPTGAPLP